MRLLTGPLCRLGAADLDGLAGVGALPAAPRRCRAASAADRRARRAGDPTRRRLPDGRVDRRRRAGGRGSRRPRQGPGVGQRRPVQHRRGARRAAAGRAGAAVRGPAPVSRGPAAPARAARGRRAGCARSPACRWPTWSARPSAPSASTSRSWPGPSTPRPPPARTWTRSPTSRPTSPAAPTGPRSAGSSRGSTPPSPRSAGSTRAPSRCPPTPCRCSPSTPPRAWSGTSSRCRGWSRGRSPPGPARARRSRTAQWRLSPPTDKGWVGGLPAVPYDLRGDRDGLPVLGWRHAPDLKELEARDVAGSSATAASTASARSAGWPTWPSPGPAPRCCSPPPCGRTRPDPEVTSRFLTSCSSTRRPGPDGRAVRPALPVPDDGAKAAQTPARPSRSRAAAPVDHLAGRRAALSERRRDGAGPMRAAAGLAPLGTTVRPRAGVRRTPVAGARAAPPEAVPDHLWAGHARSSCCCAERRSRSRPRDVEVIVPRHLSASDGGGPRPGPARRSPCSCAGRCRSRRALAAAGGAPRSTPGSSSTIAQAAMVDLLDLPGSADEDPGDDADLPLMKERFLASEWADREPRGDRDRRRDGRSTGSPSAGGSTRSSAAPGGGFTVVDWKTGARPAGEQARVAGAAARGIPAGVRPAARARPRARSTRRSTTPARGETVWPSCPTRPSWSRLLSTLPD